MVVKPAAALLAALSVPGLTLLTGCGVEEPDAPLLTSGCMVSSPAGFDDRSIGQLSFGEVSNAQRAHYLGSTSTQRVETPADTRTALEDYAVRGCTLTALLGPGGAEALADAASRHPDQAWMAVATGAGPAGTGFPDNVITIDFDLLEPAFVAGYIAAASSETGVVAAYSSYGFENNRGLLAAFDAGVELYNSDSSADDKEEAKPVRSYRAGHVKARTVADTSDDGYGVTAAAIKADADVIVPLASGAARGALRWFQEHYFPQDTAPEAGGSPSAATGSPGAGKISGGAAGAGQAEGGAAGDGKTNGGAAGTADEADDAAQPDTADEPKRALVWYGADGSETLGRVGGHVIASIVPNIAAGFQTTIDGWPRTGFAGELEPPAAGPERIGDLTVRSRSYRGTVENGGISLVASDVPLSGVAGVGREISDVQDRIRSGEVRLP